MSSECSKNSIIIPPYKFDTLYSRHVPSLKFNIFQFSLLIMCVRRSLTFINFTVTIKGKFLVEALWRLSFYHHDELLTAAMKREKLWGKIVQLFLISFRLWLNNGNFHVEVFLFCETIEIKICVGVKELIIFHISISCSVDATENCSIMRQR